MALPLNQLRSELAAITKRLPDPVGTYSVVIVPFLQPGEALADFEVRLAPSLLELLRPAKVRVCINMGNLADVIPRCSPATREVYALVQETMADAGPVDINARVQAEPDPLL